MNTTGIPVIPLNSYANPTATRNADANVSTSATQARSRKVALRPDYSSRNFGVVREAGKQISDGFRDGNIIGAAGGIIGGTGGFIGGAIAKGSPVDPTYGVTKGGFGGFGIVGGLISGIFMGIKELFVGTGSVIGATVMEIVNKAPGRSNDSSLDNWVQAKRTAEELSGPAAEAGEQIEKLRSEITTNKSEAEKALVDARKTKDSGDLEGTETNLYKNKTLLEEIEMKKLEIRRLEELQQDSKAAEKRVERLS